MTLQNAAVLISGHEGKVPECTTNTQTERDQMEQQAIRGTNPEMTLTFSYEATM